jgi:hypothetical protein
VNVNVLAARVVNVLANDHVLAVAIVDSKNPYNKKPSEYSGAS